MNNANQTLLNLDDMLNETLDNVPDAPDFSNPPAGEYTISVKDAKVESYKPKAGGDARRVRITYTVAETKSVADNGQPVPDGSMFSETFMATEQGMSYFKARVKGILNVSDLAGVILGDMFSSIKGVIFDARITIKKTPNPAGGEYENVQIRVIPPKA